jgi:hypothetical protein
MAGREDEGNLNEKMREVHGRMKILGKCMAG